MKKEIDHIECHNYEIDVKIHYTDGSAVVVRRASREHIKAQRLLYKQIRLKTKTA